MKTIFTPKSNKISYIEGLNTSIEIEVNAQGLPVKRTYIRDEIGNWEKKIGIEVTE